MSSIGATPRAAPISNARAEASRRNGARSRGPKTTEGKARSSQNALRHGLRAQKHVVLPSEDGAAFAALEAALMEELTPEGALQAVLARRVVAASWRLERADRLEAQLFAENQLAGRSLGLALIRDCNGRQGRVGERGPNPFRPWRRSFDTLLRYRGGTLAELWRALRTLKALQAEQATRPEPAVVPAPRLIPEVRAMPIEPKSRANPGEFSAPAAAEPEADLPDPGAAIDAAATVFRQDAREPLPCEKPIEPEARSNPDQIIPARSAAGANVEGERERAARGRPVALR